MLTAAIVALIGSVAAAYVVGYAFIAPRDAFVRTKRGVWALVVLGGSLLLLPPQVTATDVALAPLMGSMGLASSDAAAWPSVIGKQAYIAVWLVTSVIAFLIGIRIWRAGKPGWRGEPSRAFDTSAGARAASLLPMVDTLADALDVLSRAGLAGRDVAAITSEVRDVGRRFAASLPEKDGEVYALVAKRLPGEVASALTGLLLEGAGRRGAGG